MTVKPDTWPGGSGGLVRAERNLLRAFLADEVLPQTRAEERTLYRAARRDPDAGVPRGSSAGRPCRRRLDAEGSRIAAAARELVED